MRREFSPKVRVAAFDRAKGKCEQCGGRLYVGKTVYDHVIPDALGGEPTLENCQVLCSACDDTKTDKGDIPAIAKVKRIKARHIGAKRSTAFKKPEGYVHDWKRGGLKRIGT